jgi:hypothetical protein
MSLPFSVRLRIPALIRAGVLDPNDLHQEEQQDEQFKVFRDAQKKVKTFQKRGKFSKAQGRRCW